MPRRKPQKKTTIRTVVSRKVKDRTDVTTVERTKTRRENNEAK
jgi:hypothetical protein